MTPQDIAKGLSPNQARAICDAEWRGGRPGRFLRAYRDMGKLADSIKAIRPKIVTSSGKLNSLGLAVRTILQQESGK